MCQLLVPFILVTNYILHLLLLCTRWNQEFCFKQDHSRDVNHSYVSAVVVTLASIVAFVNHRCKINEVLKILLQRLERTREAWRAQYVNRIVHRSPFNKLVEACLLSLDDLSLFYTLLSQKGVIVRIRSPAPQAYVGLGFPWWHPRLVPRGECRTMLQVLGTPPCHNTLSRH